MEIAIHTLLSFCTWKSDLFLSRLFLGPKRDVMGNFLGLPPLPLLGKSMDPMVIQIFIHGQAYVRIKYFGDLVQDHICIQIFPGL